MGIKINQKENTFDIVLRFLAFRKILAFWKILVSRGMWLAGRLCNCG